MNVTRVLDLLAYLPTLAADAAAPTTQKVDAPWYMGPNSIFLIMGLGMILLFVMQGRSRSRQEKERRGMMDNLKRGDRVQTIGGIIATVVEAKATEVILKVDENSNTKMKFARSAIHRVLEADKADAPK